MATLARKMKRRTEGKSVLEKSRRSMLRTVLTVIKMTRNQNLKEECKMCTALYFDTN